MNKQEYLNQLKKHLLQLSAIERDDIIRDVEEHFYEGQQRGKTEEEIIASLGTAEKMAETIIVEAKLKRIDEADTSFNKLKAIMVALFAVILLTPFNLIFVLIPVLIATVLLIVGWKLAFLACISLPVAGFLSIIALFHTGLHLLPLLGILFLIIGWVALVGTFIYAIAFVTYLYFKGIVKLLKWNYNLLKKMKV